MREIQLGRPQPTQYNLTGSTLQNVNTVSYTATEISA